jgi:GH24 family phage-related lysozyme (muramidase)/peptidoglycan hydrolase-like protein with peptidoglycan-binding domain
MKKLKDVIHSCNTGLVKGLNLQIIAVMNSIVPNTLVSFEDLNVDVNGDQINPYLQPAAKESLRLALRKRGTPLLVNSAYRTIAQQYLLRRQFELGACGIPAAAPPGASNHESGLALDIEDPDGWQPYFQQHNWLRLGAFDPPHYDYEFPAATRRDLGRIGIMAFQRLWNQHNPHDPIAEDGVFGPRTAAKLEDSPSDGFGVVGATVLRLQTPPMQGQAVRQAQEDLAIAGIRIEVNGIFDTVMARAVKQFQQAHGLAVDGVIGPMTLRALEQTPTTNPVNRSLKMQGRSAVTVEGIQPESLSIAERNALKILVNLPVEDVNQLKNVMHLGQPGVVGSTTLTMFAKLTEGLGFDLSEAGVNAFKDQHKLGNTGPLRGVIGSQTADVYLDQIIAQLIAKRASNHGRTINQTGLDLVKEFEGLAKRLADGSVAAYLDAVGVPTIGYGHTSGVYLGQVITAQQAETFLKQDLQEAESAVNQLVKVALNENQFSALVSFVFNLGGGALGESTLLRQLNAGHYLEAANQFLRWTYAGGQQLPGLVRRREAERQLFLA